MKTQSVGYWRQRGRGVESEVGNKIIGSHLHWKQNPDIDAVTKKKKFTFCMFKEI